MASDKIYYLSPDEIENKCKKDLELVMEQMYAIADLYVWDEFMKNANEMMILRK